MVVKGVYLEPICERVKAQKENDTQIYCYYKDEKLKVYDPFAHQFIGKIITRNRLCSWKSGGYFVESQTGTGKSTLVVEQISSIVVERGKRLLLIIPRTALGLQYKKDFGEKYCPENLGRYTPQGMKTENSWGPADIYCLQELTNLKVRRELLAKKELYDFIVVDEVHAFVGDAAFNPYTEDILKFLLQEVGQRAKRLYLTATPDIVLEEIVELEKDITEREATGYTLCGLPLEAVNVSMFCFRSDYSYIRPVFFEKDEDIIECLKNRKNEDKALIFVRSKEQGVRLRDVLGKERSVYMDAANKMTEEAQTFSEILERNCFDKQFLISTKFLDVGVNLKDFQIKTVVLFSYYKEEMVQMLGRRRVSQNDCIDVCIKIPAYEAISREITRLDQQREEMQTVKRMYLNYQNGCFDRLQHPLFATVKNGNLKVSCNEFAFRLNEYHYDQMKQLVKDGAERFFLDRFCDEILSWFPGHQDPIMLKTNKEREPVQEEVAALLEPMLGQELDKESMIELLNQLFDCLKIKRRREQEHQLGISKLKEAFSKYNIPYSVENLSKMGKTGLWQIRKGAWL